MGIPGDSRRDSGTIYKLFVVQNDTPMNEIIFTHLIFSLR